MAPSKVSIILPACDFVRDRIHKVMVLHRRQTATFKSRDDECKTSHMLLRSNRMRVHQRLVFEATTLISGSIYLRLIPLSQVGQYVV
jgi:hypothetical protein